MPKLTIYQKPTCSTCRTVMTKLNEAGVDYDSINYIIDPPSREKLAELAAKIGESPRAMMRTKEPIYLELGLGDKGITDDHLLDALSSEPALLQRPILEYGDHVVVARPPEKVDEFIREALKK